jgi:hypothetical protein
MNWVQQRAQFQKRFDDLSQEDIQGLIQKLNTALANYMANETNTEQDNNPSYTALLRLTDKAESIKQRYMKLQDDIVKYINTTSKDIDLPGILTENGELQKQINRLEKIQHELRVDVDSSIARDQLLRSRDTDVSRHKLFIMDRPVRKGFIPYLWVFSILFVGIGLIIFKITLPSFGLGATSYSGSSILSSIFAILLEFISNRVVLISLFNAAWS